MELDKLAPLFLHGQADPVAAIRVLRNVFVMNLIGKGIPLLGNFLKKRFSKQIIQHHFEVREPKRTSGIRFSRKYDSDGSSGNEVFDAIMWVVSLLPQTKFIKKSPNGNVTITNPDPIEISDGIFVKQKEIVYSEDSNVTHSSIEVFSYKHDLSVLQAFCEKTRRDYQVHTDNRLGEVSYYFDEIPVTLPKLMDGGYHYEAAPKQLSFSMTTLRTNKRLKNVYGESAQYIRDRVTFFLQNPDWYSERGIPYTLGILLHGAPGCGKTSIIKAIANETKRHVFNIRLTESTTVSQMTQFFHEDRVQVLSEGIVQSVIVPMDKRVIVIEDIDCLTDLVMQRNTSSSDRPPLLQGPPQWENSIESLGLACGSEFKAPPPATKSQVHSQKLTLSVLLNLLDGVLETPGRILIMTSNFPEKLDTALLRPGRTDLILHLGKCTHADILDMVRGVLGEHTSVERIREIPEHHWTPAEVIQAILEEPSERSVARLEKLRR